MLSTAAVISSLPIILISFYSLEPVSVWHERFWLFSELPRLKIQTYLFFTEYIAKSSFPLTHTIP